MEPGTSCVQSMFSTAELRLFSWKICVAGLSENELAACLDENHPITTLRFLDGWWNTAVTQIKWAHPFRSAGTANAVETVKHLGKCNASRRMQ